MLRYMQLSVNAEVNDVKPITTFKIGFDRERTGLENIDLEMWPELASNMMGGQRIHPRERGAKQEEGRESTPEVRIKVRIHFVRLFSKAITRSMFN